MWSLTWIPPPLVVLALLLEGVLGKPYVHVVYMQNSTCLDFKAVPACFGPPLPPAGLVGDLVEAVPANACHPITPPPASERSLQDFVVLIRRSGCPFGVKVFHAQEAGYRAAIIYNVYSDLLVSMAVEVAETRQRLLIPSLFIGESASKHLRRVARSQNRPQITMVVPRDHYNPCWDNVGLNLWDPSRHYAQFWLGYCSQQALADFIQKFGFVILLGVGVGFGLIVAVTRWQRRRELGIKVKAFRRGDRFDLCVICMAEYEVGERLKILPCSHTYHNACIDTWLLTQPRVGKSCPICKQQVNTRS